MAERIEMGEAWHGAVAPIHLLLLNAQYETCPYLDDAVSRARVLIKVSDPFAIFGMSAVTDGFRPIHSSPVVVR